MEKHSSVPLTKKCPVNVNYYLCLFPKSMLMCISLIVDLSVSLGISPSTCFINFGAIVRCIDS